jgi:hypothetical protein
MKYLASQFEFTPEITKGMDGAAVLGEQVERAMALLDNSGSVMKAGDGVDFALACALHEAKTYQNGCAGDVLENIRFVISQLQVIERNLSALPEMSVGQGWDIITA